MNAKTPIRISTILWVVVLYLSLTTTVYRFRHPEKTETELFLEIPNALMWK